MDYIGNITQYKNVSLAGDTVTYIYKVDPINQMYGSEGINESVSEALGKTIGAINMQGAIYLIPKVYDVEQQLEWMDTTQEEYSDGTFDEVYEEYRLEAINHLTEEMIYTNDIYLAFVSGRVPYKKRSIFKTMNHAIFGTPQRITKKYKEYLGQVSKILLDKLNERFTAVEMGEQESMDFYTSLIRPIYKKTISKEYYVSPENIEQLEYTFAETEKKDQYYTRYYTVTETELSLDNARMISGIGMMRHPVTIIIKFDPRQGKDAVAAAQAQTEQIKESQRKYRSNFGREKRAYNQQLKVSKLAMQVFDQPGAMEMITQIFIRIEGSSEEKLNNRAKEIHLHMEDTYKLKLDGLLGKQHDIMLHTLPFLNTYVEQETLLNLTMGAFTDLHPLAGMKIGEQYGLPFSFVHKKKTPVLIDAMAQFKGQSLYSQPGLGVVGESGGGKTEFVKNYEISALIMYNAPVLKFDPKGAPDQIENMPWLKPYFQKIVLGATAGTVGIFDPLLRYKDDEVTATKQAKLDLRYVLEAVRTPIEDAYLLDEAIMEVFARYKSGEIVLPTMTGVIDVLIESGKSEKDERYSLGRNLKHASTFDLANLFFADPEQEVMTIDFERYKYTLIQFENMPKMKPFNPKNIQHVFASYILSKCNIIANDFIRKAGLKTVVFEEYAVWKQTPEGVGTVDEMVRLCREFLGRPIIVSQNLSDYGENMAAILTNVGQLLIGNIKSRLELEFIIQELELDNNPDIVTLLKEKGENVSIEDKYVFLYSDYNGKKAFVRSKQYNMFKEYFDTSANKKDMSEESEETE